MINDSKKTIRNFRIIAILEGWSFIVLLFIAMPLKYGMDWPYAVKYVGWLHGALFIGYFLLLVQAAIACSWGIKKIFVAAMVSFIPFGTFWLDKKLKAELDLEV